MLAGFSNKEGKILSANGKIVKIWKDGHRECKEEGHLKKGVEIFFEFSVFEGHLGIDIYCKNMEEKVGEKIHLEKKRVQASQLSFT